MPEQKIMQQAHRRFSLKAASSLLVLMVNQKKGYNSKKDEANTMKNHVFQIGESMRFKIFNVQRYCF